MRDRNRKPLDRAAKRVSTLCGLIVQATARATSTEPPSSRPDEVKIRGKGRPSDPTGSVLVATESTVDRATAKLADALEDCLTVRCHPALTFPDEVFHVGSLDDQELCDTDAAELLADALRGTPWTSPRYLRHVADACGLVEMWTADIVAATDEAWRAGATDHDLMQVGWQVGSLADALHRLYGPLRPWAVEDAPRQKPLVYCDAHPDRLAKYRGRRQCGSCYEKARRQV